MRVSLSINTFDGPVEEKIVNAKEINKSSVHVDYRGDYDLSFFMANVKPAFKHLDLHVVQAAPYDELRELNKAELLPEVVFLQLENLESIELEFFRDSCFNAAIQVGSDIEFFKEIIHLSERILIMTTTPGVSGGTFDERTFDFVKDLKKVNPSIKIYVDGGVNSDNFDALMHLGVHTVIIGSYLARTTNWKRNYSHLFNKMSLDIKLGSIAESVFELPATESTDLNCVLDVMAESRSNFALIVNNSEEIVGIVTDGDIKRQIRSANGLNTKEMKLKPNKDFIFAHEDDNLDELLTRFEMKLSLGAIPIKDKDGLLRQAVRVSSFL